MKQESFQIFLQVLLEATECIEQNYFQLPVSYGDSIYRERAYCYELYHQIRQRLPDHFDFTLNGEINKVGHPLISPICGQIIPDFLVHKPGRMGENDNLVIVEVKTIEGANFTTLGKGLLKDIQTINCMIGLNNGYYKGIILIFGVRDDRKKKRIEELYRQKCNTENVLLIFHEEANKRARII